jgi:hypothetical protein
MAIKEFTIGVSKTINLGNFQSYRVEASIVWEVKDTAIAAGLSYDEQTTAAQNDLRNLLEQTFKSQRKTATGGA